MLNEKEIRALRFYIGDVSGSDPFFGDPKAYIVLNSLFFPDISSERARAAEGKLLNPAIIADTERLTGFFSDLFSAFRKSISAEDTVTHRVERYSDYQLCREKAQTVSFTSTSKNGFLSAYRDRLGIALMELHIPAGSLCIDVGAALPHYAKPEEAEVLLPPFTKLTLSEAAPAGEELLITDSAGAPPVVSCRGEVSGTAAFSGEVTALPQGGELAGMRVYEALNAGKVPVKEDIVLYSQWKKALRELLHHMFTN